MPSNESRNAWGTVILIAILVVGLGLLAGRCNGQSEVLSPTCTNSAFARGIC